MSERFAFLETVKGLVHEVGLVLVSATPVG